MFSFNLFCKKKKEYIGQACAPMTMPIVLVFGAPQHYHLDASLGRSNPREVVIGRSSPREVAIGRSNPREVVVERSNPGEVVI